MERKLSFISLLSITPLMVFRVILMFRFDYWNIYLTIAYSFLFVYSIFLIICYIRKIFSEKLLKWLDIILCCLFLFTIFAEMICFKIYTSG